VLSYGLHQSNPTNIGICGDWGSVFSCALGIWYLIRQPLNHQRPRTRPSCFGALPHPSFHPLLAPVSLRASKLNRVSRTPSDSSHGPLQWRPKGRGNLTRSKSARQPRSLYNHLPLATCPSSPHLTHSTPAVAAVLLGLGTVVFERFKPSFWLRIGQAVNIGQVMKSIRDIAKASPSWTNANTPLAQCPGFLHCLVPLSEKKKGPSE
jgi:hypothetical protein